MKIIFCNAQPRLIFVLLAGVFCPAFSAGAQSGTKDKPAQGKQSTDLKQALAVLEDALDKAYDKIESDDGNYQRVDEISFKLQSNARGITIIARSRTFTQLRDKALSTDSVSEKITTVPFSHLEFSELVFATNYEKDWDIANTYRATMRQRRPSGQDGEKYMPAFRLETKVFLDGVELPELEQAPLDVHWLDLRVRGPHSASRIMAALSDVMRLSAKAPQKTND